MSKNSINHLAIIMDGNGRWAKQKNEPRAYGHQTGAETAKKIINDCVKKGCLLYTSPSPRDKRQSRMPSSA